MNDLKIDLAKTNRNLFVATNKLSQNLIENNEKDNKNKGKTTSTRGRKNRKAVNRQTFEELGLLLFFLYNKYILVDEDEIYHPNIKKNKRNQDEDEDE